MADDVVVQGDTVDGKVGQEKEEWDEKEEVLEHVHHVEHQDLSLHFFPALFDGSVFTLV